MGKKSCKRNPAYHKIGMSDIGVGKTKKAAFNNLRLKVWNKVESYRKNMGFDCSAKDCETMLTIAFNVQKLEIVRQNPRKVYKMKWADVSATKTSCRVSHPPINFSSYCIIVGSFR